MPAAVRAVQDDLAVAARVPRSLIAATSIDVLAADRVVERRDDHWVVRSPSHPDYWWGNLLLFDEPPRVGDAERWERAFVDELPGITHRTFSWDVVDGSYGAAHEEFVPHGYELEENVGLIARPDELRPHPRANADVHVRALDADGDPELWDEVVELQVATRDPGLSEDDARTFGRHRLDDLRVHFRHGRGSWYVALDPSERKVVGSCGIVVTDGRGRYQIVATRGSWQRRGVASRLVVDAAAHATSTFGARDLVIVAEADYHAFPLYESLGFRPVERTSGVVRRP